MNCLDNANVAFQANFITLDTGGSVVANQAKKISLGAKPFLYPEPVLLVGSYDEKGKANLMTAAWGGICNSDPVSVMVALRPATYSHNCIIARRAFTVGIASEGLIQAADYIGMASGRDQDKFAKAGLTPIPSQKVDAPYANECPVVLECELVLHQSLGLHTIMIGAIKDVLIDENCLDAAGKKPEIQKIAPLIFDASSGAYFGVGKYLAKAFDKNNPLIRSDQ